MGKTKNKLNQTKNFATMGNNNNNNNAGIRNAVFRLRLKEKYEEKKWQEHCQAAEAAEAAKVADAAKAAIAPQ